MKVSRLVLKNWRCFSSIRVALSSRTIITGPCAAGKSHFLDAFCFLRDLAAGSGLEEAVRKRGGLSRLRNLEAHFPDTDVALEVHLREKKDVTWCYRIRLGEEGRQVGVKEEVIWRSSGIIIRRPDEEDRKHPARRRESCLDPRLVSGPAQTLSSFFRSLRYENPVPQIIRHPERNISLAGDTWGRDFIEQLARTAEKVRKTRLGHISRALQKISPHSGELRVEPDSFGRWHLLASYKHWRPRASWQNEAHLADGLLRLVAILWAVFQGEGLLLIEEPELGLHPEAVSLVPRLIQNLSRLCHRPPQILLTTHHPAIWRDRLIRPEEILLLVPAKGGTRIIRGAEKELVRRFLEYPSSVEEELKPWLRAQEEPLLPLFSEREKNGRDYLRRHSLRPGRPK